MNALLSLMLLTLPAAAPPVPTDPPFAVVVVRSVDELTVSATHLGGPLGMKKEVAKLKSLTALLAGLDRGRPAGVFARWPRFKNLPDLADLVGFAYIKDEKQFLHACELLGSEYRRVGPYHRLTLSGGMRLFLRIDRGRVFAGFAPETLYSLPADDVLALPDKETGNLLARVWPGKARGVTGTAQQLARLWESYLKNFTQDIDPESRVQMNKVGEALSGALLGLVTEVRELNLRIRLDRAKDDLGVEFSLLPHPKSTVSTACQYLGKARGRFTPLLGDTAVAVQFVFPYEGKPVDAPDLPSLPAAMGWIPPRFQGMAHKLLQTLLATWGQDGLNAAVLIYPDSTSLFAVKVRQGRKLDALVRDLYRGASAAERKSMRLKLNQDRLGKARIHHLLYGGDTLQLAVRDDLIVVGSVESAGRKHLQAVLDAKLALEKTPGPFLRIEARGAWFESDADFLKKFRKEAPRTDLSALYGRLHLEGGAGFRMKARMHTQMLTALRLVIEEE